MSQVAPSADVRLIQGAVRFWREHRLRVLGVGAVVALGFYLLTGIYTVPTNQTAALFSFGKLVRDDIPAGIHWRLPAPIQKTVLINTTEVRRLALKADTDQTISMVTGDENLIEFDIAVQYQITNLAKYLVGAQVWEKVINRSMVTAAGDLIARLPVDTVLTTGKSEIQVTLRQKLQEVLNEYDAGVTVLTTRILTITPPAEAASSFRSVADAKSEKARRVNQAQSDRSRRLSQARGEAEQIMQQARSTAAERTKRAEGASQRYLAIFDEYRQARQVTRTDLYLTNMERVLRRARVMLFDPRFPIDLNLFGSRRVKAVDVPAATSQE